MFYHSPDGQIAADDWKVQCSEPETRKYLITFKVFLDTYFLSGPLFQYTLANRPLYFNRFATESSYRRTGHKNKNRRNLWT